MRPSNSDKAWKNLGETDPYWAIKGGDSLKLENITDATIEQFFDSGREHIEQMFTMVRRHLDADFTPRSALDFGCGLGRMLIPLASMCDRVVGVDVSEAMLSGAKQKCEEMGITNIELVPGDDELSDVHGTFDYIHSHIVFQHIPPKRGMVLFKRLIDLLNDNGIATIHIMYFRNASPLRKTVHWARATLPLVNNIVNFLQGERFNLPLQQINGYNLNHLFRILKETGCHRAFVDNLPVVNGFHRMMLCFQKSN